MSKFKEQLIWKLKVQDSVGKDFDTIEVQADDIVTAIACAHEICKDRGCYSPRVISANPGGRVYYKERAKQ